MDQQEDNGLKQLEPDDPVPLKNRIWAIVTFGGLTLVGIVNLVTSGFHVFINEDPLSGWLVVITFMLFGLMFLITVYTWYKHTTVGEQQEIYRKVFLVPAISAIRLAFYAAFIVILINFSYDTFSWFTTIPSWAAVIIILLVLILFSRR